MRIVLLVTTNLMLLTGCSSFPIFGNGKSEDYNKLTYGDQQSSSWTTSASAPGARDTGGPMGESSSGRKTASVSEPDAEQEEMDPTDDHVRGKVETDRGVYVSRYARGDRATRTDFYDTTLGDGSLWASDNDANYFYTKNKMRAMGDIISVKLEDQMIRHIADEVKKNLTPPEQEVEMALYVKNAAGAKDDKDLAAYRNVASADLKTTDAEDVKSRMEKSVRWSQIDLSKSIGLTSNEELRAEIIDRFPNGNYKIRAMKRIFYRGSSKKISMVAVAPAMDFDEKDLINSGKLYEYKIRVAR